jgi:hypothetical protein
MRSLALSVMVVIAASIPRGVMAQATETPEAPVPPPAVAGAAGPTDVVVMATGDSAVTEETLSRARIATIEAVQALREQHGRDARPERDPGLALRASNCADDACLVEVGRDAQAAFLFVLMIERTDAGHRVTALLVDVIGGATAGSAAFDLPSDPATFGEAIREPLGPLLAAVTSLFPTTGVLTINVDQPGAAIFLDGEQVGTSPLEPLPEVEGGARELLVSLEGFLDFEQTVEVEAGGETVVHVTLTPRPPEEAPLPAQAPPVWRRWWFWTAIGAVVVGAGLGIGLGVGLAEPDDTHIQTGVEFPTWQQR